MAAWLLFGLLLASCGTGTVVPAKAIHGKWVLMEVIVDGERHEFSTRGRPWIDFGTDGLYSGEAPCNRIMGAYSFDGRTLETWTNAISAVRCLGDGIMEREALALATLRAAPIQVTFDVSEGQEMMEWRAGGTQSTYVRPP